MKSDEAGIVQTEEHSTVAAVPVHVFSLQMGHTLARSAVQMRIVAKAQKSSVLDDPFG